MCTRLQLLFVLLYAARATSQNITWDYLVFTQSWPVAVCSFTECTAVPQPVNFVIHGLWPTSFPVKDPTGCPLAPPFNESRVASILPELERKWPNLRPHTGKIDFWVHEWSKHGRCAIESSLIPDELAYFNRSLELYDRVNLLASLKSAGIVPDNSSVIQNEDLVNTIRKLYGVRPTLMCAKRHDESAYLSEVRLCMDPQFNFIDCVPKHSGQSWQVDRSYIPSECPSEFLFLTSQAVEATASYSLLYRVMCGVFALFIWYLLMQLFFRL